MTLTIVVIVALVVSNASTPDQAAGATQTATVTWGPYTLQPATPSGPFKTENAMDFGVQMPCTDCYITEIDPELVLADGTTVANFNNQTMLHHMVLTNTAQTDTTCSGFPWSLLGERIFASGNERTVFTMPPGYGYYNGPGATWNVLHDIMNMDTTPIEKIVYMKFTFKYKAGSESLKPVTPVWLDIDNCADSEYAVPSGYDDAHWDWTSTIEGDIVSIGGHLHNRGISIASQLVESGEYFCDSVAGYAAGSPFAPAPLTSTGEGHHGTTNALSPGDTTYVGRIEDMTGCTPMPRITPGDTIRLHAQYNSPSAQTDVMGIMQAYVHETSEPPNPDDDGDGFTDVVELYLGTDPLNNCGQHTGNSPIYSQAWPADLASQSTVPDTTDMVNIHDLARMVSPVRYLGTDVGTNPGDVRFDVSPGPGPLSTDINILDLAAITAPASATGAPPMLGGERAFNGPVCPYAP